MLTFGWWLFGFSGGLCGLWCLRVWVVGWCCCVVFAGSFVIIVNLIWLCLPVVLALVLICCGFESIWFLCFWFGCCNFLCLGGDCGGVYLVLRGVSLAGDVCAWLHCTLWFMLVLVLDFVGLSLIVSW